MKFKQIMSSVLVLCMCLMMQGCKADSLEQQDQKEPVVQQEQKPVKEEANKQEETKKTLTNFIQTAMQPVGQTMYIWGGGWNEEDTGSGPDTRRIGMPERWKEFYLAQNNGYNFQTTQYQIHDGLDCSGYIGWILYNVFETEDDKPGYVSLSGDMPDDFVSRGWGKKISRGNIQDYQCGDILANENHVFLVLGQCEDGSLLIVHSAPPGVRLCGTPTPDYNLQSEAVLLAESLMLEHHPDWLEKYPEASAEYSYLVDYDQFRWNDTLKDVDHLRDKSAEEIATYLF